MIRYLPLLLFVFSINLNASDCQFIRANGANGWEPFSHRDTNGKLSGIAVEVAEKVFSQLDIKLKFAAELPWKRQLISLENGSLDLIVAAYFNDERSKKFDYSDSYHIENIRVFVRRDRAFDLKNLHSLKGKFGLRPLGGIYGKQFDQFAADNLRIEEYFDTESAMKRLYKGRNDYLVLALFDGLLSAKKYGFSYQIIPLPKNVAQLPIHFLLSKKSPCIDLVENINAKLTELKSTKFIKNLQEKYLRQVD